MVCKFVLCSNVYCCKVAVIVPECPLEAESVVRDVKLTNARLMR